MLSSVSKPTIEISFVVLALVEDGLTHAAGVLGTFVLSCTHVDIADDFAPACLHVELFELLFEFLLLSQILLGSLSLLLFLSVQKFFELSASLCLAFAFLLPFGLLLRTRITLFSLRVVWILSSSSRMRRVISSSSKSLNSLSLDSEGYSAPVGCVEG